jgi:hypothetical protein
MAMPTLLPVRAFPPWLPLLEAPEFALCATAGPTSGPGSLHSPVLRLPMVLTPLVYLEAIVSPSVEGRLSALVFDRLTRVGGGGGWLSISKSNGSDLNLVRRAPRVSKLWRDRYSDLVMLPALDGLEPLPLPLIVRPRDRRTSAIYEWAG